MDITTLGAAMAMAKKVMPQVTAADAGKLATVDSNGKWAAADLEVGQGEVAVDSTLLVSGAAADAKVTGERISAIEHAADDKASIDGYYEQMTVGNAEQLVATVGVEDKAPYNFRTAGGSADIGDREVDKVVGGTVAWNQLWDEDVIPTESALYSVNSYTSNGVTFTKNGDGSISIQTTAEGATARASVKIAASATSSDNAKKKAFSYTMQNRRHLSRGCPYGSATTYWIEYSDRKVYGDGYISTPNSSGFNYWIAVGAGTIITTPVKVYPQFYDLDLMFGTTIAAYLTSMGTGVNANGAKWFNNLFPAPYYSYDAGTLMHVQTSAHKMTGFNQFDADTVFGSYNFTKQSDGSWYWGNSNTTLLNEEIWKNESGYAGKIHIYIKYKYDSDTGSSGLRPKFVFTDGTTLNTIVTVSTSWQILDVTSTAGKTVDKVIFDYGSASNHTWFKEFCINFSWDGERDGEYEPYTMHEYPLDSSLTLRGIPKLDANNELYYDGDEYESDGTVTRKYGIVDLGTLNYSTNWGQGCYDVSGVISNANAIISIYPFVPNVGSQTMPDKSWTFSANRLFIKDSNYSTTVAFKAAMSGVYLVYELANPTTESAEPYQNPQIVDDFGTEEYVDAGVTATTPTRDVAIPVGHVSQYQANLRAKLEMAPNSPDGDGDYIVRQTNGQNEYVALTFPADELPAAPSEAGTYTLKCTVDGTGTTYTWVADT